MPEGFILVLQVQNAIQKKKKKERRKEIEKPTKAFSSSLYPQFSTAVFVQGRKLPSSTTGEPCNPLWSQALQVVGPWNSSPPSTISWGGGEYMKVPLQKEPRKYHYDQLTPNGRWGWIGWVIKSTKVKGKAKQIQSRETVKCFWLIQKKKKKINLLIWTASISPLSIFSPYLLIESLWMKTQAS